MAHTKMPFRKVLSLVAIVTLMVLTPMQVAVAACPAGQQSCSTGPGGYGVSEVFFGSGGELHACSTGQYCAKQSAGELTVGQTCSTGQYCAQAGFNTDRTEYIEFVVNNSNIDMGTLDTSSTHIGTATFSIKTYLADGYQIVTYSPPPQNGTYNMKTPASAAASAVGTEQFGINLVANTCPSTAPTSPALGGCTTPGSSALGAGPYCQTSGFCKLSNVTIGSNYNQADKYYYPSSGSDTLVTSSSSSDTTNFTISYLMNISNVTPGGTYTMDHVLIATSTF